MFANDRILERAYYEAGKALEIGNLRYIHGAVVMSRTTGEIYGSGHNKNGFTLAHGHAFSSLHAESAAMGQCEKVLQQCIQC